MAGGGYSGGLGGGHGISGLWPNGMLDLQTPPKLKPAHLLLLLLLLLLLCLLSPNNDIDSSVAR